MSSKLLKQVSASCINKENWQEKKRKLKEKFPHLTESDLRFDEGHIAEMINTLHSKVGKVMGKTKEGLHKFVEAM